MQLFAPECDQCSIDSGIDAQICLSFFEQRRCILRCLKSQVIRICNQGITEQRYDIIDSRGIEVFLRFDGPTESTYEREYLIAF